MLENNFNTLLNQVRACDICKYHLQLPPKPVIQAHEQARILVIAQAPGARARQSGKPFDDPSGDRLRSWLGVDRKMFYDETKFAMVPMGFCYPGKTVSGDLPPCKECAPIWHPKIMHHLRAIRLTLIVGSYAHAFYFNSSSVTKTVKNWRQFLPALLPLPHPSWHNNAWIAAHDWFTTELLPVLKERVRDALIEL